MLEKKYNHLEVENGKYEKWVKNGFLKKEKAESLMLLLFPHLM